MMNNKTKLVKEAKNDKASRCWSAYQKKIRQNGIRRNGIRRNAIRWNATQPFSEISFYHCLHDPAWYWCQWYRPIITWIAFLPFLEDWTSYCQLLIFWYLACVSKDCWNIIDSGIVHLKECQKKCHSWWQKRQSSRLKAGELSYISLTTIQVFPSFHFSNTVYIIRIE